jgi:hypothetical protein
VWAAPGRGDGPGAPRPGRPPGDHHRTGALLGAFPDPDFDTDLITLADGDLLVFCTDGPPANRKDDTGVLAARPLFGGRS